ncbi:fructose-1,6-bisphosphatase 1-like [Tribolium madens]|uniref:fructose-1,6-bisphosphatase 1-like n=1 Tax=Tribolium madens TaxID=41895 RepID=UPI001CF75EBD|nr:fructose-1,6-bisphosphatase 1-like [Tribolium madens]
MTSSSRIVDPSTTTLTKFIFAEENRIWQATGELTRLLNSIQMATKSVSALVRRGGVSHFFASNDKSKETKKLQTIANEVFINMLTSSYSVGVILSQDNSKPLEIDRDHKGKYIVTIDPLDGFSNADCNIALGSIFMVMDKGDDNIPTAQDVLFEDNQITAAGYALYGSATTLVLSTGEGVNTFILDTEIGEYVMMEYNLKIPKKGNTYSINEGYASYWEDIVRSYVHSKKYPSSGKPYTGRYVGSMVADVHRTLRHGGIFMYPETKEHPHGKLRLLYECKPMAFIVEQAGGLATNGCESILEIKPTELHERTPLFLGSKSDVQEFLGLASRRSSRSLH